MTGGHYERRLAWRHFFGTAFEWSFRLAAWGALLVLIVLLAAVCWEAQGWLSWQFLTSPPHYEPKKAGLWPAISGTLWLIGLATVFTVPLGVGAAIYLEEYSKKGWFSRQIRLNISNLAGIPSVVFGILGYSLFIRMFDWIDRHEFQLSLFGRELSFTLPLGPVVLSGALTLTLLSLPVVIIAAQESLRSVPQSIREAAFALGATKWQTIRHQILPAATPGILTGVILAMSRALGETAPLAVLGVAAYIKDGPSSPFDEFTAIPLQIYMWVDKSDPDFVTHLSAAGIVVLLGVLILMNGAAILIRERFRQKVRW